MSASLDRTISRFSPKAVMAPPSTTRGISVVDTVFWIDLMFELVIARPGPMIPAENL